MSDKTEWTFHARYAAFAFTLIAIPLWIILGPIFITYKLIESILQPCFLKKQKKEWDKMYQEYLKKGIYIDYPPTRGSLIGLLQLNKWIIEDDEDF